MGAGEQRLDYEEEEGAGRGMSCISQSVWMEDGQGLNLKGLAGWLRWPGIILEVGTESHRETVLSATCKGREIQKSLSWGSDGLLRVSF